MLSKTSNDQRFYLMKGKIRMLKKMVSSGVLCFATVNSVHAAEFSVSCTDVPGGNLNIVWTNSTESIEDFDRSGSRYSLHKIDESSVAIRNGLGTTVIFQGNQFIYDGFVETDQCNLTITSTDMEIVSPSGIDELLSRIEELERRVSALEER